MGMLATEDDLKLMLQIQSPTRGFSYSLSYTRSIFGNLVCVTAGDTFYNDWGGDTMEELKAFVSDKKFVIGLVAGFVLGALHHYFAL